MIRNVYLDRFENAVGVDSQSRLVTVGFHHELERIAEVAAAFLQQRVHETVLVQPPAAQANLGRAVLAEQDELAGVAVFALGAAFAERRPLGGFRRAEVADEDVVSEAAATRARQLLGKNVVDGALPVDLHVSG